MFTVERKEEKRKNELVAGKRAPRVIFLSRGGGWGGKKFEKKTQ